MTYLRALFADPLSAALIVLYALLLAALKDAPADTAHIAVALLFIPAEVLAVVIWWRVFGRRAGGR